MNHISILKFLQSLCCVAAISVLVLLAGCSDVFRPVAVPLFQPTGDPQTDQRALVVNYTGATPPQPGNACAGTPGASVGTAMVVDIAADSVLSVFDVGHGPAFVASANNGVLTYVANRDDDSLSLVIPTAAGGSPTNTILLPAGSKPVFIETRNPNTFYVANCGGNSVSIVSTINQVVTGTVAVGNDPEALAQTPDLKKVYVLNRADGTVSIIQTQDNSVTGPITVGSTPIAATFNADSTLLFVLNQGSGSISVIDPASDSVTATLPTGASPSAIVFDNTLRRLYVANQGDNTVSVFKADVNPPVLLATVPVGTAPAAIAPLADGTRVYVANSGSGNISVISTSNNTVLRTVAVGTAPIALIAATNNLKVLVVNRDSNNLSGIRTADDTVVATIPTSSAAPVSVAAVK